MKIFLAKALVKTTITVIALLLLLHIVPANAIAKTTIWIGATIVLVLSARKKVVFDISACSLLVIAFNPFFAIPFPLKVWHNIYKPTACTMAALAFADWLVVYMKFAKIKKEALPASQKQPDAL